MSLPEHANSHTSPIKNPRQLLITVVLAFLIPIVVIILLVKMVGSSIITGAGSDSQTEEAIARRIQPVAGFKLVDANAPVELKTGTQVYESTCAACHGTGVANAPKLGDKGDWAPYIEQGYESLVHNAINGINAMPPRGGNASLADLEVARAVVYMANESGASFDEPADDAAPAAATDSAEAGNGADSGDNASPAPAADADAAQPRSDAAPASDAGADKAAALAEDNPVGAKVYQTVCMSCHAAGVAGAPKTHDADAWAPYIETGIDEMLKNAIAGVGAMPPRGGSQATDEEIRAAIEYMIAAAK